MLLNEKGDSLRQKQWQELLTMQSEQLKLLSALRAMKPASAVEPGR